MSELQVSSFYLLFCCFEFRLNLNWTTYYCCPRPNSNSYIIANSNFKPSLEKLDFHRKMDSRDQYHQILSQKNAKGRCGHYLGCLILAWYKRKLRFSCLNSMYQQHTANSNYRRNFLIFLQLFKRLKQSWTAAKWIIMTQKTQEFKKAQQEKLKKFHLTKKLPFIISNINDII